MSLYIIQELHKKKNRGLEISSKMNKDTIAYIDKNDKVYKFINLSNRNDVLNIDLNVKETTKSMIVPLIQQTDENILIFINGFSGNGKSLFAYIFAKQYIGIYNQPVYFISNKRKDIDQNLSKIRMTQLGIDEIIDFDISDYKNTLFIIDDVDDGEIHKPALNVVNQICRLGREYGTSLTYITHNNSKLNETAASKECHYYITFPSNFHDNTILEKMKISNETIEELKYKNVAFACFNKITGYIICDNCILKTQK